MSETSYTTQRYRDFKRRGLCPSCGQKRDVPGRTNCKKCLEKGRERYLAEREKETPAEHLLRNELNRISQNKRRERLRAEGKCIQCGEPALPGHTLCPRHNEENNRMARENYALAKAAREAKT